MTFDYYIQGKQDTSPILHSNINNIKYIGIYVDDAYIYKSSKNFAKCNESVVTKLNLLIK